MERTGKFFLTWTYGWEYCHDGDEWVAVCTSPEELRREYLRAYEERDYPFPDGDYLQACECLGKGRFREIPPEEFLEEGDPRTPVVTPEMRREYWEKERGGASCQSR